MRRPVSVMMQSTRAPFTYLLKSFDNPPHLKFIIPANSSVLSWWFRGGNASLLLDTSLQASLSLSDDSRVWTIHISGVMSNCPAYLGITINDRVELEELFRYDLLVSCPTKFNVTFFLPNWKVAPEKTFDVMLDDATKTYHIFLTNLAFNGSSQSCNVSTYFSGNVPVENARFLVISGVTLLCGVFLCLVIYSVIENMPQKDKKPVKLTSCSSFNNASEALGSTCSYKVCRQRNNIQRGIILLYVSSNFICCILFTFTGFTLGFETNLADLILTVANFSERRHSGFFVLWNGQLDSFEWKTEAEFEKQAVFMRNTQVACNNYMEDLAIAILKGFDDTSGLSLHSDDFSGNQTITLMVLEKLNSTLADFQRDVDDFIAQYRKNLDVKLRRTFLKYRSYIRQIATNSWLMYARALFNQTNWNTILNRFQAKSGLPVALAENDTEFAQFLSLKEVESTYLWHLQFIERFHFQMKRHLIIPFVHLPNSSVCQQDKSVDLANSWRPLENAVENYTILHRVHSWRYFSSMAINDKDAYWLRELDIARWKTLVNKNHLRSNTRKPNYELDRNQDFKQDYIAEAYNEEISRMLVNNITGQKSVDKFSRIVAWDIFKFVFFAFDAILFGFRICNIFANVGKMCCGFEKRIVLTSADLCDASTFSNMAPPSNQQLLPPFGSFNCARFNNATDNLIVLSDRVDEKAFSDRVDQKPFSDNLMSHETETSVDQIKNDPGELCSNGPVKLVSRHGSQTKSVCENVGVKFDYIRQGNHLDAQKEDAIYCESDANKFDNTDLGKLYWNRFRHARIVSRLALLAGFVLSLQLFARLAGRLLRPNLVLNVFALNSAMTSLAFHRRELNDQISDSAAGYSDELSAWCQRHVTMELSHLQAVVDFFHSDCAGALEDELTGILIPTLNALSSLVFAFVNAVILCTVLLLLFKSASSLLLFSVRRYHVFPVHRTYYLSSPMRHSSSGVKANGWMPLIDAEIEKSEACVLNVRPETNIGVTSEISSCGVSRRCPSAGNVSLISNNTPSKSEACFPCFSETKV